MRPEEVLAAARERAAAARARGLYADDLAGFEIAPTDRVTTETLLEWAVIEPDDTLMRSTREGVVGRAVTAGKRALLRGLQQHFNELTSQQTRFNLHLLIHVAELEDRVAALEQRVADGPPADPTRRPGRTPREPGPGA